MRFVVSVEDFWLEEQENELSEALKKAVSQEVTIYLLDQKTKK